MSCQVPLVLVNPTSLFPPMDSWFGNPSFPSYDLNLFLAAEPPLSFGMRLTNIFLNAIVALSNPYWNSR